MRLSAPRCLLPGTPRWRVRSANTIDPPGEMRTKFLLLLMLAVPHAAHAQLGVRKDTTQFATLADAIAYSAAETVGVERAPGRPVAVRPRRRLHFDASSLPAEYRIAIAQRIDAVLRDSLLPDSLGGLAITFENFRLRGDSAWIEVGQFYRAGCSGLAPGQRTPLGSTGYARNVFLFVKSDSGWRWPYRSPSSIADMVTVCR
jgi:hypothetical protein